jgi:hypothetical protein
VQKASHLHQAHIAGGRLSVGCALYMATLPAFRFNPTIRDFYKHLRAQGKAPKLAITAAMRKLLITANTIIQQGKPWRTWAPPKTSRKFGPDLIHSVLKGSGDAAGGFVRFIGSFEAALGSW